MSIKRKNGFTFLELLIAISLFAIGMLSIIQVFPLNRKYLNQSAQLSQAVFLAQEEIEKVGSTAYVDLTVGTYEPRASVGTDSNDPLRMFERQTTVVLIDANHSTTNTDIGLKKVETTVYWTENNISRSYSLATYAYNK